MIAHRKRAVAQAEPMIFGTISWIANELIGIRSREQHLCKKLESGSHADKRFLLDQIRDLNVRVQVLDRALDSYVSRSRWN
jgi:hypothetical protein